MKCTSFPIQALNFRLPLCVSFLYISKYHNECTLSHLQDYLLECLSILQGIDGGILQVILLVHFFLSITLCSTNRSPYLKNYCTSDYKHQYSICTFLTFKVCSAWVREHFHRPNAHLGLIESFYVKP
jgi:hypothetical protein